MTASDDKAAAVARALMEKARAQVRAERQGTAVPAAVGRALMKSARARPRTEQLGPTAPGSTIHCEQRLADQNELKRLLTMPDPPPSYPITAIAQGIASDPASQQALDQAAAHVRKMGVRDNNSLMLLLIVLTWLIAVGFPIVQVELSGHAQEIAINEVATVGLALAITWRVIDKR
jgi:hypothetical protein